jgi:hypothetical protein
MIMAVDGCWQRVERIELIGGWAAVSEYNLRIAQDLSAWKIRGRQHLA